MDLKERYLDRVVNEVEDLTSRVALLKTNFAQQKASVKLEHYWELEHVRACFKEFKIRVAELQDADDLQVQDIQTAVEAAWADLVQAMDTLLSVLPGVKPTNYVM